MQAKNQPSSMKIGDFRILSFSVRYQTLILGFKSSKYQVLTYWELTGMICHFRKAQLLLFSLSGRG